MELQEILLALGGIGSGGALGWFLKQASFKAKTEATDAEHTKAIDALIKANQLQTKNNELQQKSIDNISSSLKLEAERSLMFREGFEAYKKETRHEFLEYKKLVREENDKINKTLGENTKAISALDATMKGLDTVLQMAFKNMSN